MKTRIRHKYDTLANWSAKNPVLLKGEFAIVENGDEILLKCGDGSNNFNKLPFISADVDVSALATKQEISDLEDSLHTAISEHTNSTSNPHGITKETLNLGNVDNTADSDKTVKAAKTAESATKATQDASGNVITDTYATKTEVTNGLSNKLNTSGGNVTGHLYLTGAKENSSTSNTSQIVFGNSENNHVCISSNQDAIVINEDLNSTASQIVLYLKKASVFPGGIQANVAGNLTGTASKATADANGKNIASTYATKIELNSKLSTSGGIFNGTTVFSEATENNEAVVGTLFEASTNSPRTCITSNTTADKFSDLILEPESVRISANYKNIDNNVKGSVVEASAGAIIASFNSETFMLTVKTPEGTTENNIDNLSVDDLFSSGNIKLHYLTGISESGKGMLYLGSDSMLNDSYLILSEGAITSNNGNLATSVNGVKADTSGNIEIPVGGSITGGNSSITIHELIKSASSCDATTVTGSSNTVSTGKGFEIVTTVPDNASTESVEPQGKFQLVSVSKKNDEGVDVYSSASALTSDYTLLHGNTTLALTSGLANVIYSTIMNQIEGTLGNTIEGMITNVTGTYGVTVNYGDKDAGTQSTLEGTANTGWTIDDKNIITSVNGYNADITGGVTIPTATTSAAGLLSSSDKSTINNISKKYMGTSRGALDVDKLYNAGLHMVSSGTNLPSSFGDPYGVCLSLPYRQMTGNSKPDFGAQILIPNGDDTNKPNSMFYRTSLGDTWNEWREVATKADVPKITYSTTDLTAGSSSLATGSIYIVYE